MRLTHIKHVRVYRSYIFGIEEIYVYYIIHMYIIVRNLVHIIDRIISILYWEFFTRKSYVFIFFYKKGWLGRAIYFFLFFEKTTLITLSPSKML